MKTNMMIPQKIKTKTAVHPYVRNCTSGYISKRIKSRVSKKYLHTHVHSSTIYKNQEVEAMQCSPVDEWISKMWYTHIMEYYATL